MAQKIVVHLVDDVDGSMSDDITTVKFGLDDVSYEIDLTDNNATRLRDHLDDFVNHARRTGRTARRSAPPTAVATAANRNRTTAIREWARHNGYTVSGRGRISTTVIDAYEAAHSTR
ncbi:histone-like nucleoid-structuring protein Lsr2 [Kibdelosporangium phytohabitans]|uniref:Nucleoid-associated protein Lsr2 n=1 Tax=Kibdelosporangium phytohabitans TaxID=860235 RepID=A0A0N9HY76_9PSEU|nr:Lsr2 family protein [Kibdelosporangium phytohabitans]ALG08289.1 hypothetical protein AOZ06_16465 [Kibdelosporangium phytohabitans]MBE1470685.1 hypothetical protein [Kibdelosporangium phytohabitans]